MLSKTKLVLLIEFLSGSILVFVFGSYSFAFIAAVAQGKYGEFARNNPTYDLIGGLGVSLPVAGLGLCLIMYALFKFISSLNKAKK